MLVKSKITIIILILKQIFGGIILLVDDKRYNLFLGFSVSAYICIVLSVLYRLYKVLVKNPCLGWRNRQNYVMEDV